MAERFTTDYAGRGKHVITDTEDHDNLGGPKHYVLSQRPDVEHIVDLLNQMDAAVKETEPAPLDFNDGEEHF